MARPSKPVDLILQEGNKLHLTKGEIEHRRKMEKALSSRDSRITESAQVKADEIAHSEFMRLKRLFKDNSYVEALDSQIINRYCLEISEYHQLQNRLDQLESDLARVDEPGDRIKLHDLIHKTTMSIYKSTDLLLKMEDRLFLNPSTRIKAVPKTPAKDEAELSPMALLMARRRPK